MKGAIAGSVPFIAAFIVVFLFAGGGHGTYMPAKILFPYSVLIAAYIPVLQTIAAFAAIVQYPIYGYAIQKSRRNAWVLVPAHLMAAAAVILLAPESFTP